MIKTISVAVVIGSVVSGCAADISTQADFTATVDGGISATCPYNVYRHQANGWLLTNPEAHFVFWGQYWLNNPNDQNQYPVPWGTLLNGSTQSVHGTTLVYGGNVLNRLAQYGIGKGSFDGTVYNNNPYMVIPNSSGKPIADTYQDGGEASDGGNIEWNVLPSAFIPNEINNEIQAGELPTPNSNTLYMIFLPPGYIPPNDPTLILGGYHSSAAYGAQGYTYAVILYSSWFDETMGVISHELYEASTDPNGGGWYNSNGAEVADLCQIPNENWWESLDGESVQKVWNQETCTCN